MDYFDFDASINTKTNNNKNKDVIQTKNWTKKRAKRPYRQYYNFRAAIASGLKSTCRPNTHLTFAGLNIQVIGL